MKTETKKDVLTEGAEAMDETINATESTEETVDATVENASVVDPNQVDKVIRKHVYGAMGIGIVPMPILNVAAVTGIQLDMVRQLSGLYGIAFKENLAKKIITAVIGAGAGVLASPLVESAVIGIPVVGLPLAVGTKPLLNGTGTYAVGQMFVTHFEKGGNFLSANLEAMKEDFGAALKNSREWLGNAISGKKDMEEAADAEGAEA